MDVGTVELLDMLRGSVSGKEEATRTERGRMAGKGIGEEMGGTARKEVGAEEVVEA